MTPELQSALSGLVGVIGTLLALWIRSVIKRSEAQADKPTILDRLINTLEKHADFGEKVLTWMEQTDRRMESCDRKLDEILQNVAHAKQRAKRSRVA
jgi:uncharacterized protein YukE